MLTASGIYYYCLFISTTLMSTPYPFMNLYPLGVPRSEKRKETWCVVMGISEMKSQNMSGSFRWVAGFRF